MTRCTYHIAVWCNGPKHDVSINSNAVLGEYARQGRKPMESLARITSEGVRYSFEEFDVLSAALRELATVNPNVYQELGR